MARSIALEVTQVLGQAVATLTINIPQAVYLSIARRTSKRQYLRFEAEHFCHPLSDSECIVPNREEVGVSVFGRFIDVDRRVALRCVALR